MVTLNVDGAVWHNMVIWRLRGDDSGNFLCVFASKLHPCVVLETELWGIFNGLKMAYGIEDLEKLKHFLIL
jgi:hypothetical protein